MSYQVKRIDPRSVGQIFGVVIGIVSALINGIRLFFFVVGGSLPTFEVFYSTGVPDEMSVALAALNVVFNIIYDAALGGAFGVFLAFTYNTFAPRIGGIRVQLD
jgi:hypothetical protein